MFSPAVKAEQTRLGSRAMFEDREWKTEITDDMRQFLAVIDTFFFATASADGRPYIQHRGGPPGFLKPIGTHMLAFADFAGNRQYITLGHLKENDRAHIFIPHFATRQRVKLWGRARVVEGDLELMERLVDPHLQGTAGTGDRLQAGGLGQQLPAAHPAALHRGRDRAGRRPARPTDQGAGRGSGAAQGLANRISNGVIPSAARDLCSWL
jgi:predicted pyridoxine 5'-phosphate oxidase superfamily flavin-nucleotide-binding protein